MAPNPSAKKLSADDDFVLTISDNDDVAETEDGYDDGEDDLSAGVKKTSGTKRKREQQTDARKSKKQKKSSKKGRNGDDNAGVPSDAEEENDDQDALNDAEDDGALNPDLEFDIGGAAASGVIEDFDGWAVKDDRTSKKSDGSKKGVDIDEIIARRQERKKEEEEKRKKAEEKKKRKREEEGNRDRSGSDDDGDDDGAEGEDEENDEQDGESVNFEDDELLAPDAFGMGAGSEPESGEGSGSDDNSDSEEDDESQEEDESEDAKDAALDDNDDDEDDDDDSVASPVPHPDDLESSDDSEDEEEDAEEEEKRKAFFAPEEKPAKKSAEESSKGSFQDFNLSRPILRGLAAVGFTTPTPIQRKTIPVALLGKDIVGGAVTGSGKTAAFIIPILERLLFRPRKVPTSRVAILVPTRELAVQCYNVATKLATYTDITFCQLVGGFSLREQENILKKRPDVIIATPGRFIDHMRNSASFTVDTLEILVLDEADRMLEDGFADELNEILNTIPKSRQTMLFSATMTDSVDKLIRVGLNRPVRLLVDAKKQTVGTLVQEFVRLRPGREGKRLGYLVYLCKEVYTNRVIVFFRQKKEAHRVRIVFGLLGLKAAELHGSMSQEQVWATIY